MYRYHGMCGTAEYLALTNAIHRCHNENDPAYFRYGGRGIIVCQEWRDNPRKFLEHIGKRPSCDYTLERIDNNGNYEPGNVRWATMKEQSHNRRDTIIVEIDGVKMCLKDACNKLGLKYNTVKGRVASGMDIYKAMTNDKFHRNQWSK